MTYQGPRHCGFASGRTGYPNEEALSLQVFKKSFFCERDLNGILSGRYFLKRGVNGILLYFVIF